MVFDIASLIESRRFEKFDLYERYVNPWAVYTAKRLGFDKHFVRGEGCYLFDDAGERYLDLDAGSGVFVLGRNHPRILDTMRQLYDLRPPVLITRNPHLLAGLLAEALAQRTPGTLNKAVFTNAGAETVEASLKFARKVTGRPRIIYLDGDYHGNSYGAMSVTSTHEGAVNLAEGLGPMLPGCLQLQRNDLDALREEIKKGDVAALIVEPIRGSTVEPLSDAYFAGAQALCREYGTMFIVDEILCGFGRTGKMFASDLFGLEPDMLLVSKAMSGGAVPVGAVMVRDELHAQAYNKQGIFVHRSTFMENDFAMAAGLATIHTLEEEGLMDKAAQCGKLLLEGLQQLKQKYSMIADVRGYGMLIGIELQAPKSLTQKLSGTLLAKKGLLGHMMMMELMQKHRILTAPARQKNMLRMHPPYAMSEADVRYFLDSFDSVLKAAHRFPDGISQFLVGHLLKMAS